MLASSRIVVTGASGSVGRALVPALIKEGATVKTVSHSGKGDMSWDPSELEEHFRTAKPNVIVHLAGANIAQGRWTASRRKLLVESRVETARTLGKALKAAGHELDRFVSAGAVGVYGNGYARAGDAHAVREEEAPEASAEAALEADFARALCRRWEAAARDDVPSKDGAAILRLGIVMARAGGAFWPVAFPASLGLGVAFGTGEQPFPWVHVDDVVAAFVAAAAGTLPAGGAAYNVAAPAQDTLGSFTAAVAGEYGRPWWLPNVPAPLLTAALGDAGDMLLKGNFMDTSKLQKHVTPAWGDAGKAARNLFTAKPEK